MKALFSLLLVLLVPALASAASVWIEGEFPTRSSVKRHGWYNEVKTEQLSDGKWLSHYGDAPGEATYRVETPEAGRYTLWARLNPVASKPQWRAGAEAWRTIDLKEIRQQQNIAGNGAVDHRFIGWVKAGAVEASKGGNEISFRWEGGAANSGGLDCFVLTTDPWVPQGLLKPGAGGATGAKQGEAKADEWFPLLADEDPLDPRSVIDLSRHVPAPAGQFGFLKAEGAQLKFERKAEPVKFWGVGANLEPGRYTREQLAHRAKYLRKFGINVVRQHAVFDELTTKGVLDPKKMDEYDYWFAELKKNGIHSGWSVFYHFTIGPNDGYPSELFAELPQRDGRGDTYGLITASPGLWEIRNRWMKEVLQHKNPYTGLRYVEDPALITVEMQNEDSIFFYNPLQELSNPKGKRPQHGKMLRQRFATWVKAKYRTDEALEAAWGKLQHGDSVNAPELTIMGPWELDGPGPRGAFAGQTKRAGDFIRCMAEMQRELFSSGEKAMRDAGFKGVSITTAWQVGGAASDAANTWTDTVGGMINRHNYAGGGVGGHSIAEGKVNNFSHLKAPGSGIFTTAMKQVENKPFSMTEWTQLPPNQWKLETAPLMAFYGLGLQGWDASWHFMQSGTRLGDGWPRMSSYVTDTPHYLGQFPALAFALYHGHVTEGPIVAARRLTLDELFSGKDVLKQDATKGGYDVKTLIVDGGTPLEAFAMGRVTLAFEDGKTEQADFAKLWDPQNKIVRSATGELRWDYARELVTVATAKTHAIIGRAGGDPISLSSVHATIKTPFVSLLFTPLDNLPLAESKRVLVTALAQDKQTGSRYNADGTVLEAAGTPPLLLEPVQATLKIAGAKPQKITPCDHYGVPMARQVEVAADGTFAIDGTHRAYYYLVER